MSTMPKLVSSGVLILCVAASAQSQDAARGNVPMGAGQIEEVIVTARKRAENLQETSISISVVSTQELTNRTASSLIDALETAPNVIVDGVDKSATGLTIRGISSSTNNVGMESGVGLYIDEVFIPRPVAFNSTLLDVQRIEVLRGPQGTLFGKNTIGGLISIVSTTPSQTPQGALDVLAGNDGLWDVKGYFSGPIVDDKLYGKLSLGARQSDGWAENRTPGRANFNNDDYRGARAQLRFTPTDALDVLLSADVTRDRGAANFQDVIGGAVYPLDGFNGRDRSIATNGRDSFERDTGGASLRAVGQLGDYTITSISAYRKLESLLSTDSDHSIVDFLELSRQEDFEFLSQELRLASPAERRLSWVAGLYFADQKTEGQDTYLLGQDLPPMFGLPAIPGYSERTIVAARIDTSSYAAFASFKYRLASSLSLNIGLRYTQEEKELHYRQNLVPYFLVPGDPSTLVGMVYGFAADVAPRQEQMSEGDPSGDIGLEYRFAESVMGYAKFSRGFKAGGFDSVLSASANPSRLSFGAETVDSYEVGMKSDLLDGRLRLNAAVFALNYKDKQEQFFDGVQYITTNAASAKSRGAELEITAAPIAGLLITDGIGYTDAYFDDFVDPLSGRDFTGERLAPEWTNTFAAQYESFLTAGNSWFVRGEVVSRSSLPNRSGYDIYDQGAYSLVNGRIAMRFDDRRYEVALWGRNLTNKTVLLGGQQLFDVSLTTALNPPRSYGVEFRAEF
jgi:iron complex outermembrane receptor protein